MNVFDRLYEQVILEKIYGNSGWVYHRTRTNPENSDILKTGIVPSTNKSAMYGTGLYATYDLNDQLDPNMRSTYGEYILKGKINLHNFIILDREIYDRSGNNQTFGDYLKKFGVDYNKLETYTSDIASTYWKKWKSSGYSGIIFTGRRDGRVAVIWNRRNFIPSSYSMDDGKSWVKLKSDISNIKKVKDEEYDNDPQRVGFLTPTMKKKLNKIKKVINKNGEITGHLPNGNSIYFKYIQGEERWIERDPNENIIHNKHFWGYETKYDSNGNPIYEKDSKGNEKWWEYDSNGKRIYIKLLDGSEIYYNSNGKIIYEKDSKGNETWREYDSNGKMIYVKDYGGERWWDSNGNKIPNPNLKTESFKTFFESMNPDNIDLNKAYEIFNREYLESTGKSWSKDKFLGRARNWTFYGDENGYVAVRPQRSGFVKLVGAAGSDKSKFKGFKELISENSPVWGMVDDRIASLLTKLGFRGPNKIEMLIFNKLIKSDQFKDVLGGAEILNIKGSAVTLKYPDVGTVTKYFMGSPTYWSKLKTSIPLNKLNPFKSK